MPVPLSRALSLDALRASLRLLVDEARNSLVTRWCIFSAIEIAQPLRNPSPPVRHTSVGSGAQFNVRFVTQAILVAKVLEPYLVSGTRTMSFAFADNDFKASSESAATHLCEMHQQL